MCSFISLFLLMLLRSPAVAVLHISLALVPSNILKAFVSSVVIVQVSDMSVSVGRVRTLHKVLISVL